MLTSSGSAAEDTEPTEATPRRRQYRSPLRARRAAETHEALISAAHRLFVTNGWVGTGMRDVAAEAGVATETVYAYFSSKRGLLQAVVDVAVVGDDLPVPVADRPEFAEIGRGRHRDRTTAAARLLAAIYGRTAAFAKVIREAAASDDEMADVLSATRERQRRDVAAAAELIMGRAPTATERDGLWALTSPEIYLLLVEVSGWRPEQYEAWLAETLERVVPRSSRKREGASMTARPNAPADTRMMRIVHEALRRDLRRAAPRADQLPAPRGSLLGGPARPRRRVQKHGRCEVRVDADIDTVWAVVRDVTRVGEWSHECVSVSWLGGVTSATPGARFEAGTARASSAGAASARSSPPSRMSWCGAPSPTALVSGQHRVEDPAVPGQRRHVDRADVRRRARSDGARRVVRARDLAHRDRTAALTEDLRRIGGLALEATPGTMSDVASA